MVHVAILGFGTVGSGVAEVLATNGGLIDHRVDDLVRLKYILDVRDFPDSPYRDLFVKDFGAIENDHEVDIVVETIGGAGIALDFTTRALKAGKSVVTSNKELVATHGYELLQLARANGCSYLFEASVGGGIPILRPLTSCLAANELEQVTGILNGTTNYILTRMIRAGLTFDQALAEAQANGYAEKDPTADVDGHDACRKICILAALAFGRHVYPDQVPTQGVRGVTLEDVAYADSVGCKIKLLGRALRRPEGRICAFVAPHLVPGENPLSGVEDVFNAVVLRGNATGEVMFYGRGAGEMPTASACVADVMEALQASPRREEIGWSAETGGFEDPLELQTRYYYRIEGSLADAAMAFGQVEVLSEDGETAFLTDPITGLDARRQSRCLNVLSCMRVL